VVSIMGGIRHTASEILIQNAAFQLGVGGALTWPIWLIWFSAAASQREFSMSNLPGAAGDRRVSTSAWALGFLSLLAWIPMLPWTQHEQQLRRAVEMDLRAGQIDHALATMSRHQRGDFPPHWDPPPRIGYGERQPPILNVVEAILAGRSPPWIYDIFVPKLWQSTGRYMFWRDLDSDQLDRFLTVLERLPDSSAFVDEHRAALCEEIGDGSRRSEIQKARLRALLEGEGNNIAN
jgi:hypothetical protein